MWKSPIGLRPSRAARGRVIEVLGREGDFGVDVEIVIRKHHLPQCSPTMFSKMRGQRLTWIRTR